MSEHQELADIIKREYIRAVDRKRIGDVYTAPADAILAAGYRKPRTITTAEELEALPFNSVVMYDEGWRFATAQRQAEDMRWYVAGCLEYIRPEAILPATVLHEGAKS